MLGLFRTPDIAHPQLGALKWQRGCWQGKLDLPGHGPVPLAIDGSRKGPDATAVAQAIAAPDAFQRIRAVLEAALFEHYEPYAESFAEGEHADGEFRAVSSPADALSRARLAAAHVMRLNGEWTMEFCYTVPWDEEHTLGARFRGAQWIELCGSTQLP